MKVEDLIAELASKLDDLRKVVEEDNPILSCSEAADYIGKTPVTISRYIRSGKLTKVRRGRKTGILKSDLQNLL